jgi:TrmH family RNA methyltransferase
MISKTYTKYIQSLHQKKFRDLENAFIAEGSKVVMDLLTSSKIVCERLLATQEWLVENEQQIRKYSHIPLEAIDAHDLDKISALSTPNQVLGVFKKMKEDSIDPTGKITLVLDCIQDPGNLGTIIRIADWFGVSAIICSDNCVDRYNPKVVQSTMGSLGRVELIYTHLADWLIKYPAIPIYVAALNGTGIESIKGLKEGMIVIGNESKGVSDEILDLANEKITIPKVGGAESLNAAVATGIILSHII